MMRYRLRLPLFAALIVALGAGPAAAALEEEGKSLIRGLSDKVVTVLKKGAPRAKKEETLRGVFRRSFDVRTIGRWVMGRPWRTATPAQRAEYMKLFETFIVKTYTVQLSNYGGEKLKVIGAEKDGRGVAVVSHILDPDGRNRPIVIKWRIRKQGGQLKIRDVVIDGISMALNQRREFASVYAREGSVDGLIKVIRRKIAELDRK